MGWFKLLAVATSMPVGLWIDVVDLIKFFGVDCLGEKVDNYVGVGHLRWSF